MAFKKLIWHFYVAVAFHRLPGSGRVLLLLHCSNSLRAPSPFPWKGLHRTRERAGERGGSPVLPSAWGGGGRRRSGWRRDALGARESGNDPRVLPPPPRDSPAGPEKNTKSSSPISLATPSLSRRPVIVPEWFPAGAHLPSGELATLASPPSPPPLMGYLILPGPGSYVLLAGMVLGFLAERSQDAWGEEGDRQWFLSLWHGGICRPGIPWWTRRETVLQILEG